MLKANYVIDNWEQEFPYVFSEKKEKYMDAYNFWPFKKRGVIEGGTYCAVSLHNNVVNLIMPIIDAKSLNKWFLDMKLYGSFGYNVGKVILLCGYDKYPQVNNLVTYHQKDFFNQVREKFDNERNMILYFNALPVSHPEKNCLRELIGQMSGQGKILLNNFVVKPYYFDICIAN